MQLFHPENPGDQQFDEKTNKLLEQTVAFFENKGKAAMKHEDHKAVWVQDFLDFIKDSSLFETFLTPSAYGQDGCRFDSARNTRLSEVLGFYSLSHWYPWQVSILGLGPFWMSDNDEQKKAAAAALANGGVFGFALSEKEHGADLIGTDMMLSANGDGSYTANGDKYYIGNGNCAALLSCFAKVEGSKEYAFFSLKPDHPNYNCLQNIVHSQKYVAEFMVNDYPVNEDDLLMKGRAAWDASLATVAYAKFNLGLASTGIATHAFYEAINHAGHRKLYGNLVTDFPHIKQLLGEAYARLCAMRLFSYRAKDYLRVASAEDRRYLLMTPMEKLKVTMQGEEAINLVWDVIAARGFCKDMYFESATRDIRMLPKLEGTAHVNMVLIIKFMKSFMFDETPVADVPFSNAPHEESFFFKQGPTTKGLNKVQFGPWKKAYGGRKEANVVTFVEQAEIFRSFLEHCPPSDEQSKDLDFMLSVGEIFTQIVYGSVILEQAAQDGVASDVIDAIFSFQVKDLSRNAQNIYMKKSTSTEQQDKCQKMVRRPNENESAASNLHDLVMGQRDAYTMNA